MPRHRFRNGYSIHCSNQGNAPILEQAEERVEIFRRNRMLPLYFEHKDYGAHLPRRSATSHGSQVLMSEVSRNSMTSAKHSRVS